MAMGFDNGLLPTMKDHEREKDRKKSKEFVKKNYPGLKVSESKEFSKTDEAIKFIQESDEFWVVKSDGNFGETIVPDKDDLEMAREQVVGELQKGKSLYDKGKLILEPKIMNAIEFSPQMEFYDGEPVCSHVEFETRMFGSGDIGDQTGGNENLLIQTDLDAPINEIAFPEAMRTIAREHRGLFIAEAGILSDGKDLYFTEFQANRWGWGGVFSEMSMSEGKDGKISNYFESHVMRENPFQHKFGSSLALYTIRSDKKFPALNQEGLSINLKKGVEKDVFLWQCKMEQRGKEKQLVNVGYRELDDSPLGYVVGRGETMEDAVERIYETLKGVSMKGMYFRPREDFLSKDYVSAIPNRLNFLQDKKLI
jgi:phosphoribosylamine-glycine ligase